MSKPVKEMIMTDYQRRFGELEGALIVDIRGIEANENNAMRQELAKSGVRITVVKNALARKAFSGTALEALSGALTGPAAVAHGGESVVETARLIVDWARKVNEFSLKGAVLDGEYFAGEAGVKHLSTFPTKEEAKARVVQLVLSPAGNLVGAAMAPGGNILGIVKEMQERLEKGESIAKVG
ncbi:MAG: 50S ribosomal protein L10 [Planctomycetes bacterium]|nr:50S ribosomal protein L10 [Planctomycetota bacterium]